MLLGSLLSSGGSARQQLRRLLSDGNTVAQYRADVGVTGSLAVSSWANQLGSAPALAAAGGAQPIYLPFSGSKYLWIPGVSGNYASTPNAAANRITGSIDLRARIYNFSVNGSHIVGKDDGANQRSYAIQWATGNKLIFFYTSDGSTTTGRVATSTSAYDATNATDIRATYDSSTGVVTFYQSFDVGVTWSQIGNTVTLTSGAIHSGTAAFTTGATSGGGGGFLAAGAQVYRAQAYNGINGTLAVDFNPESATETTTNGATWVSSTGETWTLNNTGSKPAQVVGSSQLLLDGTNSYMAASFTLAQPTTVYGVIKPITWTNVDQFWDGATADKMVCIQQTSSPNVDIYAGIVLAAQVAFPLNTMSIIRAVYNNASSGLGRNATAATTGAAGAGSATGGFTLGRHGDTADRYGNFQCKEIIIRNAADSAATQLLVAQYLNAIHGVF